MGGRVWRLLWDVSGREGEGEAGGIIVGWCKGVLWDVGVKGLECGEYIMGCFSEEGFYYGMFLMERGGVDYYGMQGRASEWGVLSGG